MTRKAMLGLPGYAAAIGVVLLIAIAGVWTTAYYRPIGIILLMACAVALAGLGHRWHRQAQRQRRRAASEEQIQI